MRCDVYTFAGLLTVLFVATNIFRLGHASPCSATSTPSPRASPLTQKTELDTAAPSTDELPSINLVMHPQTSGVLDLQPVEPPQVLNLQLLDSSQHASPGQYRHPNRTRPRRPLVAAPGPSPRTRGHHHHRHGAPAPAPVFAPDPMIYAPPSNNTQDCKECEGGYTSAPAGAPCGCVIPMTTRLQLSISLEKLFPLVAELAKELADSLFLQPSQVRIRGANAVAEFQGKTDVTAQFVPLATAFDNTTALLIASQIWDRRLKLNETLFGHYLVISVRYPGLPLSPPQAEPDSSLPPISNVGAAPQRPIGVYLDNVGHIMNSTKIVVIALASTVGAVIILGVIILAILKFKNSQAKTSLDKATELVHASTRKRFARAGGVSILSGSFGSAASVSGESSMPGYTGTAKRFFLAELGRATDSFKPGNIVGQGGFGIVYQGMLDDGTPVAVKVLTREDQQGGVEFVAEVEMLSRLHHRNLVKLIGICTEEIRCLVYELIPNGSVESHLHGTDKFISPLDWEVRLKIALGAARGLAYLHEDSNPRVIHRDFKASNILLEMDFTPKVSDFGLAKAAAEGGNSQHISTRVMGTFGYVAPEYAMTGHLLVKSDVYSYGVVLLELLSGRMPVDMSNPQGQENLATWARPLLTTREGLEILIDPELKGDIPFDDFAKVAAIASMCAHPEVSHRPFMGEVVQALKLVYNDSDEYEGHLEGLSPELTQSGAICDPRARFLPNSSLLSSDYDSGPFYSRGPDGHPSSASAVLSDSGRSVWHLSASFHRQSKSGPLRTSTGHNPAAAYRLRGSNVVTQSDHGAARNIDFHGPREYFTQLP